MLVSATALADPPEPVSSDPGHGQITCHLLSSRLNFTTLASTYPLRLIAPRSHDPHAATVFMLTYGGGLLSRDEVTLGIHVGSGCALSLLTQGSTKVYQTRKADDGAKQNMTSVICSGGLLAVLPDPTTLFAGSAYVQKQIFTVEAGGSLLVLDWYTAGRVSRGEIWEFERYHSVNEVWVKGSSAGSDHCIVRDAWLFEDDESREEDDPRDDRGVPAPRRGPRTYASRMGAYRCFANLILVGPRLASTIARVKAAFDCILITASGHGLSTSTTSTSAESLPPATRDFIWSASDVPGNHGALVVRAAGMDVSTMRRFLSDLVLVDLEKELGQILFAKS
ncbi:hypothetical protein HKX48_006669 [Thoreauomyces humboldtii]|nr:hypothetical protein HKX48_006669 [Thoreauomyces humboldtii]